MCCQGTLVAEAAGRRDIGDPAATPECTARHIQANLRKVGVRGQPNGSLEQTDQLKRREPDRIAEILEAKAVRVSRMHHVNRGAENGTAMRGRLYPVAAAAMTLKQSAECVSEQFSLAKRVLFVFKSTVKRQKSVDKVGIGKRISHEVGHGLDTEAVRDVVDGGLREIEPPIGPVPTTSHPGRLRLGGVEDEERA